MATVDLTSNSGTPPRDPHNPRNSEQFTAAEMTWDLAPAPAATYWPDVIRARDAYRLLSQQAIYALHQAHAEIATLHEANRKLRERMR